MSVYVGGRIPVNGKSQIANSFFKYDSAKNIFVRDLSVAEMNRVSDQMTISGTTRTASNLPIPDGGG